MKRNGCWFAGALWIGTVVMGSLYAAVPGLLHEVSVEQRPAVDVAYVEQVGSFQGNGEVYDQLLEKLLAWAIPSGYWVFPSVTKIVAIYPDDPSVPPEQQRLWLGITVPSGTSIPEGIFGLTLPEGLYAVGSFAITAEEFGSAWSYMYGEWLPASNYQVGDGLSSEWQKNDSSEDPGQKHLVDICIPVQPKTGAVGSCDQP